MRFVKKALLSYLIVKNDLNKENLDNFSIFIEQLISLSYLGDIRNYFGLEKFGKFYKIFKGNETMFREIYEKEFKFLEQLNKTGAFKNYIENSDLQKLECFQGFQIGEHSKDAILNAIKENNKTTSINMAISQFFGQSILKNVK